MMVFRVIGVSVNRKQRNSCARCTVRQLTTQSAHDNTSLFNLIQSNVISSYIRYTVLSSIKSSPV